MKRRTWMSGLGLLVVAGLVSAQPLPGSDANVIAFVDGVEIRQSDLDAVLSNADSAGERLTEPQMRQARMRALNLLIDNILLRRFLETKIQPVPPAEIQRRLAELDQGLRDQTPRRSLAEFCQEKKKTIEQFKEEIADELRWNTYVTSQLSQEKLMEFYKKNKAFFDGVKVRASHIVIRLPAEPAMEDRERFDAWKRADTDARAKLEALRNQLRTDPKADFAELARTYSQDHRAKNGGDLGLIERKWFEETFTRAAFDLPKDGISEVVVTSYGLHLIKVTDRTPGRPSDFSAVREAVRELCSEEMRQQILVEQRRAAKIQILLP